MSLKNSCAKVYKKLINHQDLGIGEALSGFFAGLQKAILLFGPDNLLEGFAHLNGFDAFLTYLQDLEGQLSDTDFFAFLRDAFEMVQ